MRTPEICLAAVKQDGYAIMYVSYKKRTAEICLAAVKQQGWAYRWVPEDIITPEMIAVAIENSPDVVELMTKRVKIHHGTPKQMPEKAYDTLEMGYDEYSAIVDGELMVDFHKEFDYGRYYRKATFEKLVLPSKLNPATREAITEYTIYQAKV
jgi:hypothetical protein